LPIPTCDTDQYWLKVDNLCHDCNFTSNCLTGTCTGAQSSTCTRCVAPYILKDGLCVPVPVCAAGTYLDVATNTCLKCVLPTTAYCVQATCTNANSFVCNLCADGYTLRGGVCQYVPTCTKGTYLDTNQLVCVPCALPNNCATGACTRVDDAHCTVCQTGYQISGQTCVPTCSAETYLDSTSNCVPCTLSEGCTNATCTTAMNSVCQECDIVYNLKNGQCVDPYIYMSGSGSGSLPPPAPVYPTYSAATDTNAATDSTTVSNGGTTVTATTESSSPKGFAIAVGVFAGIVVALLVTLVVVMVTRSRQAEHI